MTAKTNETVRALAASIQPGIIAAYRYLAFIDRERSGLLYELWPDRKTGDYYFMPEDEQVSQLAHDASPIQRAVPVLTALGIDPHASDFWTGYIPALPVRICRPKLWAYVDYGSARPGRFQHSSSTPVCY